MPVAERLSELATELFAQARRFSEDASDAFRFYISEFGSSLDDIDKLYIPARYQDVLKQEYLTCEQAWNALGLVSLDRQDFPFRFGHLEIFRVVRGADGSLVATDSMADFAFPRESVASACRAADIPFVEPSDTIPDFLSLTQAYRLMKCRRRTAQAALLPLHKSALRTERVIRSDALQAAMLADFKCQGFPHWPYVSNSRSTRLDDALLVWHEQNSDSRNEPGKQERLWWKPRTVSAGSINRWISNEGGNPPILFALLDVHLRDGTYPSITIHKTRKRHHTQALLAGVSEPFLDELAGRTSGRQSDHYDRRTAQEIVTESIEGFDPDEHYEVMGPVAKLAPDAVKVVERRAFLFENAAPKHVTEVGGCRTDWSLNPCEQFGDCMRCGKSVWRKGDQKRLPLIIDIRSESLRMLSIGKQKLHSNPRLKSITRQIRQCEETIARCDRIIAIENDPLIAVGTIATFDAAPTAFGTSDLANLLRSERGDVGASRLAPAK